MFDIFYKKNNNKALFNSLEKEEFTNIRSIKNYIPIYHNFFSIEHKNYNNINLNHKYKIANIVSKETYNIYTIDVENDDSMSIRRKVFFKFSPLLDPIKYLTGKYIKKSEETLFTLPELSNKPHKKMLDPNNSAYVDSFFSFLTSKTLHTHHFQHGLDFYGSFLCIQNNYTINVSEDLEYLSDNKFFLENREKLFKLEEEVELFVEDGSRTNKQTIVLEEDISLDVDTIDDTVFDNVFELTQNNLELHNKKNELICVSDISLNKKSENSSENSSSETSCSSRSSNTEKKNSVKSCSEEFDDSEYSSFDGENIDCILNKFPVQMICLEKMENTLDFLLGDDFEISDSSSRESITESDNSIEELSDEEWRSCLFQIIMTLVSYQKMFDFTHNDLHTNNIMFNTTDKKFLFYKFNNTYYKVPTYGKIYKIIDFGRSIYRFKDKIICSDSYHPKGDAATQYNCEPYVNNNKPRLEPNKSFDLCRLGCALYDYFAEDIDDPKVVINPIGKLIQEWCTDDKGKNILYKKNGEERYPDFKLYKMIARTVHNHIPSKQLNNPIFYKYEITKKKIKKKPIMNIDEYPIYYEK
jgi:hypothetical protein